MSFPKEHGQQSNRLNGRLDIEKKRRGDAAEKGTCRVVDEVVVVVVLVARGWWSCRKITLLDKLVVAVVYMRVLDQYQYFLLGDDNLQLREELAGNCTKK